MSVVRERTLHCPVCNSTWEAPVFESLNATRAPGRRDEILAGAFQVTRCPHGHEMPADGPFIYIDLPRKQWITCYPRQWQADWRTLEREGADTLERTVESGAMEPLGEDTDGLCVRAVFGLHRLREKLLCFEHGIDDTCLEACKLDLMGQGAAPLDGTLVLDHLDANTATFAVLGRVHRSPPRRLSVPVSSIRALADSPEWSATREKLSAGPFVDVARLL